MDGSAAEPVTHSLDATQTQTYGYDELSRLTSASMTGGPGNQSWTFDANGNRETHAWTGGADDYHPHAQSNKLESAGVSSITGTNARNFEHDAIGNIWHRTGAGGEQTYAYDSFNRMSSVTLGTAAPTEYLSNTLNQRVRKSGTGGAFNYLYAADGTLLAETAKDSPTLTTFHIYLEGQPVAVIKPDVTMGVATLYFVHNDHLGRPEVVTDALKGVKWKASNRAYDRTVLIDNLKPLADTVGGYNIGFPGQYFDAESGLWYNLNRYYDAATGRYMQSDPIGLKGGINTFAYVSANPAMHVDPKGLESPTISLMGLPAEKSSMPSADFVMFSFDLYVFSAVGTFSKSGNSFLGGGVHWPPIQPNGDINPFRFGASVALGYLNEEGATGMRVDDFLEGWGFGSAAFYYGAGGGVASSPTAGTTATLVGVGAGLSISGVVNEKRGYTGLEWGE